MMTNREFLDWLGDRLVEVYKESPNVDFVLRLRMLAEEVSRMEKVIELIFRDMNMPGPIPGLSMDAMIAVYDWRKMKRK